MLFIKKIYKNIKSLSKEILLKKLAILFSLSFLFSFLHNSLYTVNLKFSNTSFKLFCISNNSFIFSFILLLPYIMKVSIFFPSYFLYINFIFIILFFIIKNNLIVKSLWNLFCSFSKSNLLLYFLRGIYFDKWFSYSFSIFSPI